MIIIIIDKIIRGLPGNSIDWLLAVWFRIHRSVFASKNNELAQLFDFVANDGSTFVAIEAHTARFQTILAQEEDHIDGMAATRKIRLENPIVSKIYQGLLKLRNILST